MNDRKYFSHIYKMVEEVTERVSDVVIELSECGTHSFDSNENIKKAILEKKMLEKEKNNESFVYKFEVSKLISYNETNDLRIEKNKKVFNATKAYLKYQEEIQEQYKINDILSILTRLLNTNHIKLNIEFFVNNIGKDTDNLTKPFIDSLLKNSGSNDNKIYEINSFKIKNCDSSLKIERDKNKEFALVKIEKMTQLEIESSSLLKQYNNELNQFEGLKKFFK